MPSTAKALANCKVLQHRAEVTHSCSILLSSGARASSSFRTMTFTVASGSLLIKHSEDQLHSLIARFMVEAKPGARLDLPSTAFLEKRGDGRIILGRDGFIGTLLFNETSDDIMARIIRWSKG